MPIIDREKLMVHVDGNMDLLRETFELFCDESKLLQSDLRTALETGNLESIHMVAHALRGMISNFMAATACQTLDRVQEIDDPDELPAGAVLLDTLSGQIDLMTSEIQQILAR